MLALCNNSFAIFLRVSVIIICLLGLCVCAVCYPFMVKVGIVGAPVDSFESWKSDEIAFGAQLYFYWFASIPCFLVLLKIWGISIEVKKGLLFSQKVVDRLNASSRVLAIDCAIFLLAQIIFSVVLYWDAFRPIYIIIGVLGLIFSYGLFFTGRYIGEAIEIKVENEGYV